MIVCVRLRIVLDKENASMLRKLCALIVCTIAVFTATTAPANALGIGIDLDGDGNE
ncbi:hypothetical protein ACTMTI_56480 [Nonomuraea sp. H19]|uniref:hypothetical protein n=1 Tax=Nonomuraea sp. H19 TaxID=3452206 RepID=UPI003F8CB47B